MPPHQLTDAAKNHNLDNNDNFSGDNRFLCYDTRETIGPGIGNSQSVEKIDVQTGEKTVLYAPEEVVTSPDEWQTAPGAGAASFNPVADEVVFIHGPFVHEVPVRGLYAKPNRRGAVVPGDGSQRLSWLDCRDIATDRDTLPGAHRGGTHRHEYSLDGRRVGFTYDDFFLPQYGRTIGYLEPHPNAPEGATHWFALLVRVVPRGEAKPGDIVQALGDSWIGREGKVRAFIGTVMEDDGSFADALFTVTIPEGTDITTADSGNATRYPTPPVGLVIRRLTKTCAPGIVRGSHDGTRIAYYALDAQGVVQLFIVPTEGGEDAADPVLRPEQATHLRTDVTSSLRWHPDGHTIFCVSNNGVVATTVTPGDAFGKSTFLTPQGDGPERFNVVCSHDGKLLAWNQAVPVYDAQGMRQTNYAGQDFLQIFTLAM
jgi:hypothetical protein